MVVAIMFVGVVAVSDDASAATCSTGTATLRVGSKGEAVKCLQTAVGVSADGSFGPMTAKAVMAWQASEGLTADGVFGSASRAAWLGGSVSGNFPAGCQSASGYSMTTGTKCDSAPSTGLSAGCSSLVGYSTTTGAKCDGAATPAPVTTTGEGSVTVTYDPTPADNLAINRGENKAAMALKIKATGSDMKVSRVWLDINTRIWLSADTATLWDGSTLIATLPLSASTVEEITVGSAWRLQFNSLNVTVPVNATKVLTFKVNRPAATSANASVTIAATSTLRTTDAAGITATTALTARTWNLANAAGSTGTLTNTLAATAPLAQSVAGLSTTSGTLTAVKLADFNLKAIDGIVRITDITGFVTQTSASTCTIIQCVSTVELRDGTTVLDSVAPTALTGAYTFDEQSIDVADGATKVLSVWVKVNHIAASFVVAGDGITALVTSVTGTSGPAFAAANATPDVTGYTQYLYQYAPTFALVNTATYPTSATQVDESNSTTVSKTGAYKLSFSVTAPNGSDIYVDMPSTILVQNYAASPSIAGVSKSESTVYGGTLTTSSTVSGTASTGSVSGYDKVTAGATRYFTITGYIPKGTAGGDTGIRVSAIKWTATDATSGTTIQTWGISDLKTDKVRVTLN